MLVVVQEKKKCKQQAQVAQVPTGKSGMSAARKKNYCNQYYPRTFLQQNKVAGTWNTILCFRY